MTADVAATWQVWIGGGGLLFVMITAFYARNAWSEAEEANRQTREFFAAERRPWLSLEFDLPTATLDGAKAIAKMQLQVHNIGLTPATDVSLRVRRVLIGHEPNEPALRSFIEEEARKPLPAGVTVFPNQRGTFELNWTWENATAKRGEYPVFLHGFVAYRVTGDTALHYTPFIQRAWFRLHPNDTFSHFGKAPHAIAITPR